MSHGMAFDILAACSGYLYALSAAYDFLQNRPEARLMIVTAEALSQVVNADDFNTAILFGDAATATIVYGAHHLDRARMLTHRPVVAAKPDASAALLVPNPGTGFLQMEGRRIFGEAVRMMVTTLETACAKSKMALDSLTRIVPHQANGRIIEAVQARLGKAGDRVINNIAEHGNTSSSTIPICLADADHSFRSRDKIGLCAFGGGFTVGAAILEIC